MRTRNPTRRLTLAPHTARWSSFPPALSTLPPQVRASSEPGNEAVSLAPRSEVQRTRSGTELSGGLVQALLESSIDGVLVLDARLRVCAVNRVLTELAETSSQALLERHVLDVFPLMQQLGPDIFEFVLQGRTLGGTLDCVKPEQKSGLTFEVKFTPVFDASSVVGILGIVRDITQQREHMARMNHFQKLGLAARLASSCAHDLSNLLTVVHSEVSSALLLCDDSELRGALLEIRQCAEKSGELTREMLNFSRKNSEYPMLVQATRLVTECQHMFAHLLGPDIALTCALEDEPGRVSVHRGQLEQVLVNLIANARDAMAEGGTVEISVRRVSVTDASEPSFGQLALGEYCCIQVRDTGHGMSEAVKQHLFEPFFTTKPEGAGTGLGLCTSREMMEAYGGQIAMESEPGRGTTVSVFLPRLAAESVPTIRPCGPIRGVSSTKPIKPHPSDRPRTGSDG